MRTVICILAVCMVLVAVGCETTGTADFKIRKVSTWQCLSEPQLAVAVISIRGFYTYCEVRSNGESGAVEFETTDIMNMFRDGFWVQVEDSEPLLGPPPPTWVNTKVSDRPDPDWVKINGSAGMPGRIYKALPVHDAIQVSDLFPLH